MIIAAIILIILLVFVFSFFYRLHPFVKYTILKRITKVEKCHEINIDGDSYPIKDELIEEFIDDHRLYLTDKQLFKKYCDDIIGKRFEDMFDENDFDEGEFYVNGYTLWVKYSIFFKDGSYWFVDFSLFNDGGGPDYRGVHPHGEKCLAKKFDEAIKNNWNISILDEMNRKY